MNENRSPIISRKYQKATDTCELFVAQISDGDIKDCSFQYEIWINSSEQTAERITSGNAAAIRRPFISKLLEIQEDGWSKKGAATYGNSNAGFFDPAEL